MKKAIQIAIGILISGFFLYHSFKAIDFEELKRSFATVSWLWVIPFVAVTLAQMWMRAIRWKLLLAPEKDCTVRALFGPLMIGMGLNSILPLRAGEFARPLALRKTEGIPFPAGLSSVVLERVLDSITLLGLFALVPLFIKFDPAVTISYSNFTLTADDLTRASRGISVLIGILVVGIVVSLLPPMERLTIAILHKMPLPTKLKHKLDEIYRTLLRGFQALRSPKAVTLAVLHSIAIWCVGAVSFQIMALGVPSFEMGFWQAIAYLVITAIAISLPSVPGFWGLYEAGGILACVLIGLTTNDEAGRATALAYTLICHFFQWLPITIIGLGYAAAVHVGSPKELLEEQERGV